MAGLLWSVATLGIAAGAAATLSGGTTGRSLVEPVHDRIIHLSVYLPVGVPRAFEYFTRVKLLEEWLAPAASVEARVGGRYELFWEPSDRENNSTVGCRVTALSENQFLSFQWRSPKQFKTFANGADPLTHVVVVFLPEGARTRVHLIHSGWRSAAEWEEARAWQERAWTGALAKLERTAR
jgi:uncharacterized protein YndB with AHSA1/START domain